MAKKIEKKTTKTSKKLNKKSIVKDKISESKNTAKKDIKAEEIKDIEVVCAENLDEPCKQKKCKSWKFRILASLLLIIGLLWLMQFKFFAKNSEMDDDEFKSEMEAILDEEAESSAEIVDSETGEIIETKTSNKDYSSEVEELKRDDMPGRIDEEFGEFDENAFNDNSTDSSGELKETFEDDKNVFEFENKEVKLEEMEEKLAESNKKIEELTKKLEKTNAEFQNASSGYYSAPLVIKLINLKEKIGTGESFYTDLDDLEYFANGDVAILKAVSDIRKYADGLNTKAYINEEFQKSAIEVMKIHNTPAEDSTFLSKIMYNLTKNIVVRKTDESKKPSETEQILIDAEKLLSKEKYKEAVLEIIKLHSKYSEPFDKWVDDTSEFVYVNDVLYQAIKYAEEKK